MNNLKISDIKRGLKLPEKNSEELAELYGILAGDGYVKFDRHGLYHDYYITISGHSKDDQLYHINYIAPLFRRLFGLNPKVIVKTNENCRILVARSKTLVCFLKKQGYYKYKGKITIPNWIFDKDIYFDSFIRGLFDTDGSLAIKKRYREKPYYPVITITLKNKKLIAKVANYLKNEGFNLWWGVSKSYYNYKSARLLSTCYKLQLSGFKNLLYWKQKISFSNQKHLAKYEYVIKEKFGASAI